ncbi:hypothetical protein RSAG8_08105, partial [Rhizoctonia solani AG-8 WAC10335]
MSHTPARGINPPRLSGIPTPGSRPGTATGIPGRPRSSTGSNTIHAPRDTEAMSKALQEAIKANDPTRYSNELSPQLPSATFSVSGRRSVAGIQRPPSAASTSSSRSKTPVSATSARPRASLPARPESRTNIGRSLSHRSRRIILMAGLHHPFLVGRHPLTHLPKPSRRQQRRNQRSLRLRLEPVRASMWE